MFFEKFIAYTKGFDGHIDGSICPVDLMQQTQKM